MPGITIIGSGSFAPGEPVKNQALTRVMETDDEWIKRRTGIEQRHFAKDGQGASDIAKVAAERALENAGISASDLDYIIFCTMTPDYIFPGSGGLLGAKLGIPGVPALDIRQQCAAMPFAFQLADGLAATSSNKTILVVGAEAHAGFMPWRDWSFLEEGAEGQASGEVFELASRHRGLTVLFGDGAGALVMRRSTTEGHGLLISEVHTDGNAYDYMYVQAGGFRRRPYFTKEQIDAEEHIPSMKGADLFKAAVHRLPEVIRSVCARTNIDPKEIDVFVPHQANDRINQAVAKALGVAEDKVVGNIARYGNTSGGTIPILVDECLRSGRIQKGQLVCFVALGSGLHWGASLMRI